MSVINFDSENLVVDWISFNLEGLTDPKRVAALKIIENGKDYEILKTNLQPSFWRIFFDKIKK